MSWITRLFQRKRLERELDAELGFHLEQLTRDLIAAGHSPAEANRRARIALGGVEQIKEDARDVRGTRWLEDLGSDIRFALRMLRKSPGFTAAAVTTLALGIGANTAMYSVVDALFLRLLPVDKPEELHALERIGIDQPDRRFSAPQFRRFVEELPAGARAVAMTPPSGMYLSVNGPPESVRTQLVSGEWFPTLGVVPAAGRLLGDTDDRSLDGHPVVVLSHAFWTRRFGADVAVIGRPMQLNGLAMTVIGVAQSGFTGLDNERQVDIWLPVAMQHAMRYRSNASLDNTDDEAAWGPQEGARWLTVVVRAPPEAPLGVVEARLATVFRRDLETSLAQADSAIRAFQGRLRLGTISAARGFSNLRDDLTAPMKLLGVTVGLVLLIACANLAGLILARNAAREQEITVRVSLGARTGRLLRQVLTESLTLALIGGAVGLVVARLGAAALLRAASSSAGSPVDLAFDWRLLAVTAGLALAAGVLFGIPPAWRVAKTNLYDAFRSGGRVVAARGQVTVGRSLVVGQIAISLTLIVMAAVLVRSVRAILAVDPGYNREQVVTARVDLLGGGVTPAELPALYRRLEETVAAVPGVSSASLSTYGLASRSAQTSSFEVPGKERPAEWDDDAQVLAVSTRFFETVGVTLLRGRFFTPSDGPGPTMVAVISETMARRFFDTADVVGRRFGFDSNANMEVVGVVRDVRAMGLREEPRPFVFFHLPQDTTAYIYSIEARVTGDVAAASNAIRAALTAAEPRIPVRDIASYDALLDRGVRQERVLSTVIGLFGVLAALLAAVGLYGVMAYAVARRTNELGVRLALGASPTGLRRLVVGDSMKLVVAGVVLGLGLMTLSLGLVQQLVFGVSARDPLSIAAAVAALLTVGFAAAAIPAWRASRVDPVVALRRD